MSGKDLFTAQQFISAIPKSGGIVTKIAERVGCAWNTARKYIDTHPTVKQAYDDECENILDMAESALIKSVSEQEAWAVKYMLSTKGKARGYVERSQVEQTVEVLGSIPVTYQDYRLGIDEAEAGPGEDSQTPGES